MAGDACGLLCARCRLVQAVRGVGLAAPEGTLSTDSCTLLVPVSATIAAVKGSPSTSAALLSVRTLPVHGVSSLHARLTSAANGAALTGPITSMGGGSLTGTAE